MRPLTPFVPGTEAVGVVIAVGGKITRFPSAIAWRVGVERVAMPSG